MVRLALLCAITCGCDVVFGIAAVSTTRPPDAPAGPAICPASYDIEGRYRLEMAPKYWHAAMQGCLDDQIAGSSRFTHLAVFGDDAERVARQVPNLEVWIGLDSFKTYPTFVWVTDEPITGYPPASGSPWAGGIPDNTSPACVVDDEVNAVSLGWNDRKCDGNLNTFASLCECDEYPIDQSHF